MTSNEGRLRLDRTLTSPAFSYKESVNLIVKRHLVKSSLADAGHDGKVGANELALGGKYFEEVAQHWSNKIWTFLEALKSASAERIEKLSASEDTSGSSREWKLKDQNDRHRVMYREGPIGTPFHTLCLDGVMDGNMANALCVGWEVPNYKDWFPQFTVPTFKITEAKWLRKVRVGEALSLLRLKVPWPVSPREIVMSSFELEYFEEDIIIVLLESAPDADEINEKLHGFSADDLPAPCQNVRMNLCGGFIMQKMNADQFFFRTIADLDMKLDFVPPMIINFISRQLAGQGLKLYQKLITAVGHGTGSGKVFQPLLKTEPLYDRVKEGLDAKAAADGEPFVSLPIERLPAFKDSVKAKTLQGSILRIGSSESYRVVPFPVKTEEEGSIVENEIVPKVEITQISQQSELQTPSAPQPHIITHEPVKTEPAKSSEIKSTKKDSIIVEGEEAREYEDPEVEWAVTILDKMIAYSRTCAVGSGADATPNNATVDKTNPSLLPADVPKPHVEICRSAALPTDVTKVHVNIDKGKPPLTPVKNQNLKKGQVSKSPQSALVKTPQRLVKQSPSMLLSSGEIETSGMSGFLSASEIEVVSGLDDTDAETGASSRMSCPSSGQEPEVQSRRRRNRWRWGACFSPILMSKRHHRRNKSGMGDSGRASEGHWRSTVGDSGRSLNQRGYVTDGDERYGSHGEDYPPGSDGRFVTLGELLMDDGR
ncbi:hypothetical protein MPTK1_3g01230 [Marchantia polymorpha subsp. ruderalis]|uniref:START domain-containing protein n=2 Tax=Marchantia polymorpha TaxID=3197 RepID=A0A176WRH8_MARPO|nr:hypothetical protein AXG93_1154s1830 [Marchantia polymorpha subsp. ruderalis]PTQ47710.1 hypothetical protein MARPO_0007s0117 [Marchantia polymorpha]BBN04023.1 hypothetical protein Mp_3g01230 [Marchantia polymorpha subsp. ruderalis]|eukprot:PTQ47710.1 hypothetical protein MARPO_0007s0117 [Marchantia polymorpha]